MMLHLIVTLILLVPAVYGQGLLPSTRPSTGVQLYLPFEYRILPDYSMIQGGQFYNYDGNSDAINDALYCQSASSSSNIGVWYYPDGTQVPLFTGALNDASAPSPIFSKRFTGQIALARRAGLSGIEGLYKCIIPDEYGTDHTLVVGIYRGATYNSNDGPDADSSMMFSLISTRDANPPIFTLSFNVSDGLPTNVTCTDGTNPLNIASSDLSRVIVNGPGSVTQVTVRVRMRQAGTYQCTVSNDRVTDGTIGSVTAVSSSSSLSVTVAGTPSGVTATRLNLVRVRLSWSSVSGVDGYEVFYQPLGSNPISANITTNTMVDITSGLSLGVTYNLFVVSYGDGTVLPSDRSTNSSVTLQNYLESIIISLEYQYNGTLLTCSSVGATNYQWKDLSTGNIVSNTTMYYINNTNSSINWPGYQCIALLDDVNKTATFLGINPVESCENFS